MTKIEQEVDRVHIIEVVRSDNNKLILPEGMPLVAVKETVERMIHQEEEFSVMHATMPTSTYDGALALSKALERKFGIVLDVAKWTMFGLQPPTKITLEVDAEGHTLEVPWGRFEIPNIDGWFETSYAEERGVILFQVSAKLRGRDRHMFDELVSLCKVILADESIYRGKSISINFTDDDDDLLDMPEVKFMRVRDALPPIFSRNIEEQLENDVLAYIRQSEAIKTLHGSIARGILMGGPYGTGKTLSANYIARVAEECGFTFIYTPAKDVPHALDFANNYLPAVVFAEDIDTVAGSSRSDVVNNLLLKLDGVGNKNRDLITVFTTNHVDRINPAMLRPGRVDVLMNVQPPDAEASVRIASFYAGGLPDNFDFTEAGKLLDGTIPAQIREAVKRAQVRALARTKGESAQINPIDLENAARSVISERAALQGGKDEAHSPAMQIADAFGNGIGQGMGKAFANLAQASGIANTQEVKALEQAVNGKK